MSTPTNIPLGSPCKKSDVSMKDIEASPEVQPMEEKVESSSPSKPMTEALKVKDAIDA